MGTALACACVSLTMTARCCVHNEKLHLRRTEGFHYDPEILKRAFRIGTPVAVQEIAINSAMVAATMIIAPLGAVSIAANSFAVTAESLCYMPGYGIGSAATTLVGRSVGAGEAKQAKRYGNICTAMGACFMAATGDHDADLSDCIPGIDTGSIRTDAGGTGTSYRTSGGTIVWSIYRGSRSTSWRR